MNYLAEQYGLLDQRVLAKSQELDELLNDYERRTAYMYAREVGVILLLPTTHINNSAYIDNNKNKGD